MFITQVPKIMRLVKEAATELGKNHPFILASSTAFFTTFSIPPMIIIVVNALSIYFRSDRISAKFNDQITSIFGPESAKQLQTIADNFSNMGGETWITIVGFIFLVFIATNLFNVIKISINQIWNIRPTKSANLLLNLKNRAIALGLILLTGAFFLLSTVADSLILILKDLLESALPSVDSILIIIVGKAISFLFIMLWFSTIFRFLPDAKIYWKAVSIGAAVTSILFLLGKVLLEKFLVNSNLGNIFETSASIVLVLLFIFYSSMIMYFGAAFTYVISKEFDKLPEPRKNAEKFEVKTIVK